MYLLVSILTKLSTLINNPKIGALENRKISSDLGVPQATLLVPQLLMSQLAFIVFLVETVEVVFIYMQILQRFSVSYCIFSLSMAFLNIKTTIPHSRLAEPRHLSFFSVLILMIYKWRINDPDICINRNVCISSCIHTTLQNQAVLSLFTSFFFL